MVRHLFTMLLKVVVMKSASWYSADDSHRKCCNFWHGNTKDNDGWTGFHQACFHDCKKLSFDLNAKGDDCQTAFHNASEAGYFVRIFMENAAALSIDLKTTMVQYFPKKIRFLFTFILCSFSVQTLKYFQKNLNQFFVHKNFLLNWVQTSQARQVLL